MMFMGGFGGRRPRVAPVELSDLVPWSRDPARGASPGGSEFACSPAANEVVCLWRGSIISLKVDAIVNAANESLYAGGGVCGAIHDAAGPELETECERIGTPPNRCPTGQTVLTRGYKLPAKYVLHTVGPRRENHDELRSCYTTILDLAAENGIKTLALCCVSTGIFGFPLRAATLTALDTVRRWLDVHEGALERVVFVVFRDAEEDVYRELMPEFFPAAGPA